VFFALKNAIGNARKDSGLTDWFSLNAPATCERLRMSCKDEFTRKIEPDAKTY